MLRAHGALLVVGEGGLQITGSEAVPVDVLDQAATRQAELIAALEAEAAGLVARGHDIIAALAARGISVRLGADGTPWAAPANLLEAGDLPLLAAYREEVLAALRSGWEVWRPPGLACRHPHVVIRDGVAECQRCDMRCPLRPADEADEPLPEDGLGSQAVFEAGAAADLADDGFGIIAALADRGISVRLDDDGRPWAAPADLVDEADRALLAAHRDAVLAALSAAAQGTDVGWLEVGADAASTTPGSDHPRNASTEYGAVHIEVQGDDPRLVDELAAVLARHPGPDPVLLHFVVRGSEVVMLVGDHFRVTGGPELEADLAACFEREVVRPAPAGVQPAAADDDAGMPGVELEAGVVHVADVEPVPGELTGAGTALQPHLVLDAPASVATGGLVPGQEGRPASPGAEPTGESRPGTAFPPQGAPPHEQHHPHVTPGPQAIDLERALVTTASEWERVKADVLAEPVLGLDTEAIGLDPFTARLRLVQLAARGRVYVVDAFRLDPRALQPVADRANRLVGHNLKFDLRMLMAAGLRLPADLGHRLSDTMLAAQLLGAGLCGERYRLADLTQRYLGVELDKAEQTSDWSGDLSEDQLVYAARDAAVLLPLRDRLRAELELAGLGEVAGIESRVLPAVAWLEQSGAPFDQAAWLRLAEIAEERRRRLERELDAMAPSDSILLPLAGMVEGPSRWNSPAQVLKLLASRSVVLPNTRDETLHEHHDDDPLIPLLLQHRDAAKQSGAFGREFLRFVHPVTGRIHADLFQLGSESGRASCRAPNLQQIPHAAEYRACFRALEGRVLVGADYSQIEPRIAAEISGEERLLAAYRERRDVYRQVASELGVERGVAKTIVLGALYGLGARGLARRLKADAGIEMAEERARSYLDAFFAGYPALDRWRRARRTDGPTATRTLSGRRRLNVENYTQKINTPIQGSAADVFKLAMALLHESRDTVPSAGLVLSVHDELVLEVGEAEAEVARRWLADCMKRAGEQYLRRVPVVVEAGTGLTWADTKGTATPVQEDDEWAA